MNKLKIRYFPPFTLVKIKILQRLIIFIVGVEVGKGKGGLMVREGELARG